MTCIILNCINSRYCTDMNASFDYTVRILTLEMNDLWKTKLVLARHWKTTRVMKPRPISSTRFHTTYFQHFFLANLYLENTFFSYSFTKKRNAVSHLMSLLLFISSLCALGRGTPKQMSSIKLSANELEAVIVGSCESGWDRKWFGRILYYPSAISRLRRERGTFNIVVFAKEYLIHFL